MLYTHPSKGRHTHSHTRGKARDDPHEHRNCSYKPERRVTKGELWLWPWEESLSEPFYSITEGLLTV